MKKLYDYELTNDSYFFDAIRLLWRIPMVIIALLDAYAKKETFKFKNEKK